MGRVWAARQLGSPVRRIVAVKTALPAHGANTEFHSLFMDEARIASMIHHPHVCGVHELAEASGNWFLVLEWSDGASLRQLMDALPEGKVALPIAVRILANVAAGLHAAHELEDADGTPLEVVHRDVSPQNVLICRSGHVKVTDFGVARAAGQLHEPTETGEMKGKLSYMAPEQVTATRVDRRADIFAMGCVLYEATLGRHPFHGDGALSTLYRLLEEDIASPTALAADYPPELSEIVMKALAKSPEDRYRTAEELRIALEGWLAVFGHSTAEREIAELVETHTGGLIEEKARRLRIAMRTLGEPELPAEGEAGRAPAAAERAAMRSTVERGVATPSVAEKRTPWFVPVVAAAAVLGPIVAMANAGLTGSRNAASAALDRPASSSSSARSAPGAREPGRSAEPATAAARGGAAEPASPMRFEAKPEVVAPPSTPQTPGGTGTVRIRLVAQPPSATLRVDGGKPVAVPFTLTVPADGEPHVVMVEAPGHVALRRKLTFDRDEKVVFELERAAPRRSPTKSRRRVAKRASRASAVDPAEHLAAKKPGRRARRLDLDNPFGG